MAAFLATALALLPQVAHGAPELAQCPTLVREMDDDWYGHGWLMACAEGFALVVPSAQRSWAILYPAGERITGVAPSYPDWVRGLGK